MLCGIALGLPESMGEAALASKAGTDAAPEDLLFAPKNLLTPNWTAEKRMIPCIKDLIVD